jgi:hypothetical protein
MVGAFAYFAYGLIVRLDGLECLFGCLRRGGLIALGIQHKYRAINPTQDIRLARHSSEFYERGQAASGKGAVRVDVLERLSLVHFDESIGLDDVRENRREESIPDLRWQDVMP